MKSYLASDLREKNRMTVYRLITSNEEISRTEISRITNISSPTVIKIMNFFIKEGLVMENGEGSTVIGRKPQMYKLNANKLLAIGAIFEGDYIRAGIVNLRGEILCSSVTRAANSFEDSIQVVLHKIIEQLTSKAGIDPKELSGIGIGVPGSYNPKTHTILMAPLIGIREPINILPLEEGLAACYGLDVSIGNDVNMDVTGEYRTLGLQNDDFVYISLGTGLGAGIILNGHLRLGTTFNCGEIGYMAFMDNYVAGINSPGWLESKINLRLLKQQFGFDPYDRTGVDLSAIVDYVSTPVALCIHNIGTLLDCYKISLGGILTQSLGDPFVQAVSEKVRRLSVIDVQIKRQICEDPGVVGASLGILDKVVENILKK